MPGTPTYAASNLDRIDHVVVLMMENRSFDNLLGWLYQDAPPPRGQPFDGLSDDMWCPFHNADDAGRPFIERVHVRRNGEIGRGRRWAHTAKAQVDFCSPTPDPGEGFGPTTHELFGGYRVDAAYSPEASMAGFVDDYQAAMRYATYQYGAAPGDPREIMTSYTRVQTQVLSTLARAFAVSDRWYASVPSQTFPNRDFMHAATSKGRVSNGPDGSCDARTIFEALDAAAPSAVPWRVYSGNAEASGSEHSFSLTRLVMTRLQSSVYSDRFRSIAEFADDAARDDLATYTFLEPNFHTPGQNDQKPPSDIRPGERLIAEVYDALRTSPCWERTLLVITYDEHGGCFDHVPPPAGATPPSRSDGPSEDGFRFDRFGVRVPAVIVSPLIEEGTVARPASDVPFDHTSVLATLHRRFGTAPLTDRDAAAPDLAHVLTLDAPRTDCPTDLIGLAMQGDDTAPADTRPVHPLTRAMADTVTAQTGLVIHHHGRSEAEVSAAVVEHSRQRFG